MKNYLDINMNIVDYKQPEVEDVLDYVGDYFGRKIFRDGWSKITKPGEKLLRILTAPETTDKSMTLYLGEYDWRNLMNRRIFQKAEMDEKNPLSYSINAIVLTANSILRTTDGKMIFHYKKGGYKNNSIHTFGGYVHKKDLESGGIEDAIKRELCEPDELGLDSSRIHVCGLFGTEDNIPSILWDWGTAAIYGDVYLDYTSKDITDMLPSISMRETQNKRLFFVQPEEVDLFGRSQNLHPQTKKILSKMEVIHNESRCNYPGRR